MLLLGLPGANSAWTILVLQPIWEELEPVSHVESISGQEYHCHVPCSTQLGGGGGNKLDIFMPENVNLVLLMADQSLCIFSQSPKKFNPAH